MGKRTDIILRRSGKQCHVQTNLKFEVFGWQRRTFVKCRINEKMLKECLEPSAGMVEETWWSRGALVLVYWELRTQKRQANHAIFAILCGHCLTGGNSILQQNDYPKHCSKLCKTHFCKRQSACVLPVTDQPKQPLDLSPIEQFWEPLGHMIQKTARQATQTSTRCFREREVTFLLKCTRSAGL